LLETRLQELKKKGVVRRATNQPDYALAQATKGIALKTEAKKPTGQGATPKASAKLGASAKPAVGAKVTKQRPLRETHATRHTGTHTNAAAIAFHVHKEKPLMVGAPALNRRVEPIRHARPGSE
jgi:hypothetical protein